MERLLRIGFRKAGEWKLQDGRLRCVLSEEAPHPNVLYALVVGGAPMYVGKTTNTLAGRMGHYANGKKSTNLRIGKTVREHLAGNGAVEIWVLPDEGLVHIGPFHLNLAAGLEDSIIATLDPPWNGGKREGSLLPAETGADREEMEDTPLARLHVTLQPTYAEHGFFNLGVDGKTLVGSDRQTIEIFLGDADEPVLGSINRTSSRTKAPRIMGGRAVRDWFRETMRVGDVIDVEILSPLAIRLRGVGRAPDGAA